METIKAYTDIEQSYKLADILSLNSADMKYFFWENDTNAPKIPTFEYDEKAAEFYKDTEAVYLPCWSLAALLNIIRKRIGYTLQTTYNKNPKVFIVCELGDKPYTITSLEYDNEVDACVEMIIKLKEHILL